MPGGQRLTTTCVLFTVNTNSLLKTALFHNHPYHNFLFFTVPPTSDARMKSYHHHHYANEVSYHPDHHSAHLCVESMICGFCGGRQQHRNTAQHWFFFNFILFLISITTGGQPKRRKLATWSAWIQLLDEVEWVNGGTKVALLSRTTTHDTKYLTMQHFDWSFELWDKVLDWTIYDPVNAGGMWCVGVIGDR